MLWNTRKITAPPFSVKPWELSLHDANSYFGKCPHPSPKGLYGYRSQMSSHGWRLESFHLKATQSGSWAYWYMTLLLIALWNSADYAIVGHLEPLRGNFTYVPLRIAQGAFEHVPWVVFRQSRLQKAASVLWLYRLTLMTSKYFLLTKKMMKPVTLHQKMPSRYALRNGIFLIW